MEYKFEDIGKRIKEERKKAGFKSQDALIDALNKEGFYIGRNKLSDIEQGKTSHYDFDLLVKMCELFKCEISYLLCEEPIKMKDAKVLCDLTGLSPEAVNRLIDYKNRLFLAPNESVPKSEFISQMLENDNLIHSLFNYVNYSIDENADLDFKGEIVLFDSEPYAGYKEQIDEIISKPSEQHEYKHALLKSGYCLINGYEVDLSILEETTLKKIEGELKAIRNELRKRKKAE